MTPREPDRFDAQAMEVVDAVTDCMNGKTEHAECISVADHVAAALRAAEASAMERAAQVALDPYGEEVQCYGGDEPFAVGKKIAKAVRALIPPAASPAARQTKCPNKDPYCSCQAPMDPAPAADYDPITAPIPEGDMNGPHGPLPAAETGKAQGTEARPFDKRCADALADEVAVLVQRKVIDSRSPAADALLDYRNPPRTPRSDRLAELETALRKICAIPLNSMAPDLAMRSIAEVALAARAAPPEEPTK